MSFKKIINIMDKVTTSIEFVIAFSLLVVIVIKLIEIFFTVIGYPVNIVSMDFEKILSAVLTLVIGVEFIKMLCKHTPDTVIDVLLFAMARQIVIYHENSLDLLLGVVAIVGLFAAKKFLIERKSKSIETNL